jgi:catechol 2,3-dioxygenase-like lactoylglutathione lyase family enzyme
VRTVAAYAGIIVTDLARSLAWYREQLPEALSDGVADGWVKLTFADDSEIELVEGDPTRPGLSFPSYGRDDGPPVLPGYACPDPDELAEGLTVARRLPDWIVVVTPDGLRLVLAGRDGDTKQGLVAFRYTSPDPAPQQQFLERIGSADEVVDGAGVTVVPVLAVGREATLTDPDGNTLVLVREYAGA